MYSDCSKMLDWLIHPAMSVKTFLGSPMELKPRTRRGFPQGFSKNLQRPGTLQSQLQRFRPRSQRLLDLTAEGLRKMQLRVDPFFSTDPLVRHVLRYGTEKPLFFPAFSSVFESQRGQFKVSRKLFPGDFFC